MFLQLIVACNRLNIESTLMETTWRKTCMTFYHKLDTKCPHLLEEFKSIKNTSVMNIYFIPYGQIYYHAFIIKIYYNLNN